MQQKITRHCQAWQCGSTGRKRIFATSAERRACFAISNGDHESPSTLGLATRRANFVQFVICGMDAPHRSWSPLDRAPTSVCDLSTLLASPFLSTFRLIGHVFRWTSLLIGYGSGHERGRRRRHGATVRSGIAWWRTCACPTSHAHVRFPRDGQPSHGDAEAGTDHGPPPVHAAVRRNAREQAPRGFVDGGWTDGRNTCRTMVSQLLEHERIKTTLPKAKELRRIADRMVSLGKKGTLHSRRQAERVVRGKQVMEKLFGEMAERYKCVANDVRVAEGTKHVRRTRVLTLPVRRATRAVPVGSEQRTPRRIRSRVACRQKEFGFGTHGVHRIRGSTRRVPTCQTAACDAQLFRFICTACASGPTFPIKASGCPRSTHARWPSLCCNKRNSLGVNSVVHLSLPICASQTSTVHASHCTLMGAFSIP